MSKAGHTIRRLTQARDDLERIIKIYADRHDTVELLGDPRRGSDYDGNVRSGISDPTPTHAMHLAVWHDLLGDIETTAVESYTSTARLWQLLNRVPSSFDSKQEADRARCTGGVGRPGDDTWGDPTCERLAVTRTGLCSPCYQREHHWLRAAPIEGAA